jgi:hypothetical protein
MTGVMARRILGLFFVILLAGSCSSGSSGGNGSNGSGSTSWNGSIEGVAFSVTNISSQVATTESDGGVLIQVEGTNAADEEVLIQIDISGGANIQIADATEDEPNPTASVQVGSGTINVNLYVDGVRFIAASGAIEFSAYDATVGGRITGTLVGVGGTSFTTGDAALLDGDFDLSVSEPVIEEDEL